MGLTISHASALRVTRDLRAQGEDLRQMSNVAIARPSPWVGRRWSMKEFFPPAWKWDRPSPARPLHVVTTRSSGRIRLQNVRCHVQAASLPPNAVVWLDERSSMCGPEYLFVQMAESLTLPELVLLGYELCGNYSRSKEDPTRGPVTDGVCPATTVDDLYAFAWGVNRIPGAAKARQATRYIADHAVSVPEAILATMYSLPTEEGGYDMGPVRLNERVSAIDDDTPDYQGTSRRNARKRYPDLMFSFASIGINYDGVDHLDLSGLVEAARRSALADPASEEGRSARSGLDDKLRAVRTKYVDDIQRNRQLAARGKIVFPATKEDLYGIDGLDALTRQVVLCAHDLFGAEVSAFLRTLDDTALKRDRNLLLSSMLP